MPNQTGFFGREPQISILQVPDGRREGTSLFRNSPRISLTWLLFPLKQPVCLLSRYLLQSHYSSLFPLIMQNHTPTNMSSDTERQTDDELYMFNDVARSLSWSKITLTVEDRSTKQPRDLVSNVSGQVNSGKSLGRTSLHIRPCGKSDTANMIKRRSIGLDGPFGKWQDDIAQLAGRTCHGYQWHRSSQQHFGSRTSLQEAHVFC